MSGKDLYANSDAAQEFENDFFKGRMLFLLQTTPPDPKVNFKQKFGKNGAEARVVVLFLSLLYRHDLLFLVLARVMYCSQ